jgi:transcriptional regulator with XRE-family HTH domain
MAKRVRWRAKQRRLELAAKLGRDVTLEEVSKQTGIAISTLSNIENNRMKGVEFNTLERLATFYQVGCLDGLLGLDNVEEKRRKATLTPQLQPVG